MKQYQLILLIILASILQVSFFYSDIGNLTLNAVLIITWFLYLNEGKDTAAYFAIGAGILTDLLRLHGMGTTSFSILLPMLIFLNLESIFQFTDTVISYFLILLMVALTGIIFLGINYLFGV